MNMCNAAKGKKKSKTRQFDGEDSGVQKRTSQVNQRKPARLPKRTIRAATYKQAQTNICTYIHTLIFV